MLTMASSILKLFILLSIFISLLFVSASARPCKTLLISSYTFSIRPLYPNPNSNTNTNTNINNPSSSGFVTIVTEISQQRSYSSDIVLDSKIFRANNDDDSYSDSKPQRRQEGSPLLPFGLSSYDMSSLRDRTKDILSVVVALLFGVGCGALTAATMYLVWYLFSTRYDYRYEEFDDEDEEEEEDVSLKTKKVGYVKIPDTDSLPKQATHLEETNRGRN